jgi:hypothetical protein
MDPKQWINQILTHSKRIIEAKQAQGTAPPLDSNQSLNLLHLNLAT